MLNTKEINATNIVLHPWPCNCLELSHVGTQASSINVGFIRNRLADSENAAQEAKEMIRCLKKKVHYALEALSITQI